MTRLEECCTRCSCDAIVCRDEHPETVDASGETVCDTCRLLTGLRAAAETERRAMFATALAKAGAR